MILHRLTLRDFGLFSGEQTFCFTPRIKYKKRRPVILIGGKNGTGKTTILEAVRLCLYGPRSLGNRVSRKEYDEYLASTVHHSQSTLLQPDGASVALEFEYAHSGDKDYYHVERRWEIRQSTKEPVRESLIIHKENEPLSDFEAEHWQDFLNELIPIGLSQLFFFDGEKIQGLAEDASSPVFLADSIKSLLGVDLVERLQSDLKIYLNRAKRDAGTEQLAQDISSAEKEHRNLQTQLNFAAEKKAALEVQVGEIGSQIALQEDKIAKEGGGYARQRDKLKVRQAKLSQKISDLEKQIRDACAGLFPFALAAPLCERLRTHLIQEAEIEAWDSANKAVKDRNRKLLEQLEQSDFWDSISGPSPKSSVRVSIRSRITSLLTDQLQRPENLNDVHRIHFLPEPESQRLLTLLDSCLTKEPDQFRALSRQLEDCNRQLQKVETDLGRIPSDEVLAPLTEGLATLNQRLGVLQKELQSESSNIQTLAYRLNAVERRLDQLYESQRQGQADSRRAQLVSDVRLVLDKYSEHLTHAKVEALTKAVVECFGILCRKHSLVKRIDINPLSFVTTLYDQQNRLIAKDELSAGEKQIYAISLLWGLAKASGRPLPMIIDTPLGRLDSEHRQRMIEHYFPNASHQVLVLSTDTELDKQNFEILSPQVSHAYHLVYNHLDGSANVEQRYFWRTRD